MMSMSAKELNPISEVLFGGRGLGILYHTFEGELEAGPLPRDELEGRKKDGKILSITYTLNPDQCERTIEYSKAYQALRVGRSWGLPHRPLFGEGGSSAAFGVSFLEVAGVLSEIQKEAWTRGVQLPLEFSGPPVTNDNVSFLKFLYGADHWASGKEKSRALVFFDSEKIYTWIGQEIFAQRNLCPDQKKGICIDVSSKIAPKGSFWKQSTDPIYWKTPKKP